MDGNGMRAVPSPSGSNLPTFLRWCLGGMAPFASASARDAADARARVLGSVKGLNADCGDISASQGDLLARAHCLGGPGDEEEEEEAEVFSTPPRTPQDPQRQGQSQRGQAGEEEEGITMCSMPFTPTQPSPPSPASSTPSDSPERVPSKPRKPRVCTRKVKGGPKNRTPTPSPSPQLCTRKVGGGAKIRTPTPSPSSSPSRELDPLTRIVLMIPTAPLPTTGHEDILELARSRGIF